MLFDFGGTLDADGIHWAPRFHSAYQAAGGGLDYPRFEACFQEADRELERLPGIRGLGFRAMIEAQARLVCGLAPDGARVEPGAMAASFHAAAVATVARNRPVLERLSRGHRLGVVSNFTGNLDICLEELELRRCFEVVTDSALARMTKPDRRIFTETLERFGVPPAGAWMVGDNFESDIRPAVALGMRTCWLAPPQRTAPPGPSPTARIARLTDVETALGERAAPRGTGACTA